MSDESKDVKPQIDSKTPSLRDIGTLIPETFIDVPSQRLYYLSLGVLCQVRLHFASAAPTLVMQCPTFIADCCIAGYKIF